MKSRAIFSLTALLISAVQGVAATQDAADQRLKKAVHDVVALAEHAPSKKALAVSVRPILLENISFETMTRRAIGPGWRQFTPQQQKEATSLFTELIIRTYTGKFTPGEVPAITFKTASTPSAGRVETPTNLLYKGSHYDVTYRQEESTGWRITDVVIEGVSLIANYRTQFDASFKEGGADAVISALRRSVESSQ
jgi:phospholipid transport system substrate-binding protein